MTSISFRSFEPEIEAEHRQGNVGIMLTDLLLEYGRLLV